MGQSPKETSYENGKGVNLTVQRTVKEGKYKTISPQLFLKFVKSFMGFHPKPHKLLKKFNQNFRQRLFIAKLRGEKLRVNIAFGNGKLYFK